MLKKLKVLLCLGIVCAAMTSISAASRLMEWEETAIVGKASTHSFYDQGQKVSIHNNIYNAYNVNVVHARVTLRKYEWWGKSDAKVMHQYGLGEETWYYSTGKGSHYDMYFADAYGDSSSYYNPMDMNYVE